MTFCFEHLIPVARVGDGLVKQNWESLIVFGPRLVGQGELFSNTEREG